MPYLLYLLALAAAVLGVLGDTYDQKRRRPTVVGWLTLLLAVGVCGASIAIDRAGSRDSQARAHIAHLELLRALEQAVLPFLYELPPHELDVFWTFRDDGGRTLTDMLDGAYVERLSDVPFTRSADGVAFRARIKEASEKFVAELGGTLATYGKDLEVQIVEMARNVQRHEFVDRFMSYGLEFFGDESYRSFMAALRDLRELLVRQCDEYEGIQVVREVRPLPK